jgi:hypothetical protein
MALKVVPAGDDRCDVHNSRRPQRYICKDCMRELGIESVSGTGRRWSPARVARAVQTGWAQTSGKVRVGVGVGLLVVVAIAVIALGASGGDKGGPPTQSEVVDALDLISDPGGGTGWQTADGTCVVISIVFGNDVRPGPVAGNLAIEVTNEQGTVGAVVRPNYSSYFNSTEAQCAERVQSSLRDHF